MIILGYELTGHVLLLFCVLRYHLILLFLIPITDTTQGQILHYICVNLYVKLFTQQERMIRYMITATRGKCLMLIGDNHPANLCQHGCYFRNEASSLCPFLLPSICWTRFRLELLLTQRDDRLPLVPSSIQTDASIHQDVVEEEEGLGLQPLTTLFLQVALSHQNPALFGQGLPKGTKGVLHCLDPLTVLSFKHYVLCHGGRSVCGSSTVEWVTSVHAAGICKCGTFQLSIYKRCLTCSARERCHLHADLQSLFIEKTTMDLQFQMQLPKLQGLGGIDPISISEEKMSKITEQLKPHSAATLNHVGMKLIHFCYSTNQPWNHEYIKCGCRHMSVI